MNSFPGLTHRFKSRLLISLSLVRAYRFVAELEPSPFEESDPALAMAGALVAWRRALRAEDGEAALDAVERTWVQIEACRQRVMAHDTAIQAYRVRWACENAPLRHPTIESLGRLYRLLPFSTSSQSKYEYVLTRLLAGPIRPGRRLAPTEDLIDAVVALEASWGAIPVEVGESEVAAIIAALKSFAQEASLHADVASFTASALLRRFGAFKTSIRDRLFAPPLSVAVVETNVAVLNVLNQLLAAAGGQPLRWTTATKRPMLPLPAPAPIAPPPPAASADRADASVEAPKADRDSVDAGAAPTSHRTRADLRTGEIDLSGLDFVRSRRKLVAPGGPGLAPPAPPIAAPIVAPAEPMAEAGTTTSQADAEPPPEIRRRPDLKTGEVDLSGLEFVRRLRHPSVEPSPEAAPAATNDGPSLDRNKGEDESASRTGERHAGAAEAAVGPGTGEGSLPISPRGPEPPLTENQAPVLEAGQQPSVRAFALGKLPENAAIIEWYLSWPRSPEVWQLDLDVFLSPSADGSVDSLASATERRRSLELILASDDLIGLRLDQEGAPSAEHRVKVKAVANAMLLLRTSLRRAADQAQRNPGELESLLYISDHLLWERLRLEASLKRNPTQKRTPLLPRTNPVAEIALSRTRLARRHRQILLRILGAAAAVTTIAGVLGTALPRLPIDPEVTLVQLGALPGAQLFDDARAFKSTLFISAGRTWLLLSKEERRSIVRGLGTFAVDRGFDTVSVVGPGGEPWASFKDDEVILAGELSEAELAKR